jgi:carboxypeptidase C (cathepsin A)
MSRLVVAVTTVVALMGGALAAYAPDEITSLPGWTGALPSKQYSGYLHGSNTTRLHYWFVQSEASPETAATVVWFNGTKCCDGYFQ